MTLATAPFLPLAKGVVDSGNSSIDLTGAVRSMKGFNLSGANRLVSRAGDAVQLTFKDDAGSPANVTSVCGIWQFKDRAIAIAHSTNTNKCYLYVLKSDLTDWYNGTTGALTGNTSPQPAAVIWSSITVSPDVFVAEGLGTLYIAHSVGVDANALNFSTKSWNGAFAVALSTMTADLDSSGGAEDLYFNGVIAFQSHLWAWGFGSGTTATSGYDPSKARFSAPFFGAFSPADSITLGNRTKSDRERIINGGLAGNSLILQGTYITSRVTGYGRSSWYREIVDEANGIAGPKAGVSDGGYWYYWSSQGPMRIGAAGKPEPLDEPVRALVASVINPEKVVAGRDIANNSIFFLLDTGSGVRTKASYHVRRNIWTTTSDDVGLAVRAVGEVTPIVSSTSAGVAAPAGPPTTPSTTNVGGTVATAHWVNGDASAQTQIEYRVQGTTTWIVATTVAAGLTSYQFAGLSMLTAYEWRAAHVRSGQYSTYLGPVAGTQFTTTNQLQPPTNLALSEVSVNLLHATWTNSGESGVDTEIWVFSPGGSAYTLKAQTSPGISSSDIGIEAGPGSYLVKIRHVKSGLTASNYEGPNVIGVS